jgi:hypothetical protein
MGDVLIVAISAAVGLLTLIFSRLRCRQITTVAENGDQTHISACGFSDRPLMDEKMVEQITPVPGSILLIKK